MRNNAMQSTWCDHECRPVGVEVKDMTVGTRAIHGQ